MGLVLVEEAEDKSAALGSVAKGTETLHEKTDRDESKVTVQRASYEKKIYDKSTQSRVALHLLTRGKGEQSRHAQGRQGPPGPSSRTTVQQASMFWNTSGTIMFESKIEVKSQQSMPAGAETLAHISRASVATEIQADVSKAASDVRKLPGAKVSRASKSFSHTEGLTFMLRTETEKHEPTVKSQAFAGLSAQRPV